MPRIVAGIGGGILHILIADDHPLYLAAVRDQMGRLFPEALIEDGKSLDDVTQSLDRESGYDLILLDYSMPGMSGPVSVRAVVDAARGAPVVVMSGIARAQDVSQCIGCGAKGFLPKTLDGKIFASALNVVLGGGSYLPAEMFAMPVCEPEVRREAQAMSAPLSVPAEDGETPDAQFSERERAIMGMVVAGKSNKEIARVLNLREVTIKVQLTHIYRKLGAKNRAQAATLVSLGGGRGAVSHHGLAAMP